MRNLFIYLPTTTNTNGSSPSLLMQFQDQWPADCADKRTADVDTIRSGPGRVHQWTWQIPDPVRIEGRLGPGKRTIAQRYCDGRPTSFSIVDGTNRGLSAGEEEGILLLTSTTLDWE